MKAVARWILLVLLVVLSGCATAPKLEKRREERSAAYSSLSPEFRALVDQGRIKVGMPMDAVYIAWGKPSQVVSGESTEGPVVTWLYHETYYEYYPYYP